MNQSETLPTTPLRQTHGPDRWIMRFHVNLFIWRGTSLNAHDHINIDEADMIHGPWRWDGPSQAEIEEAVKCVAKEMVEMRMMKKFDRLMVNGFYMFYEEEEDEQGNPR